MGAALVLMSLFAALLYTVSAPAKASAAPEQSDSLEREVSFHIEPGPLESALIQFSLQSHIQIVLSSRVAGTSATPIEGRRNAREVLTALLSNSGLTFAMVGGTVTV